MEILDIKFTGLLPALYGVESGTVYGIPMDRSTDRQLFVVFLPSELSPVAYLASLGTGDRGQVYNIPQYRKYIKLCNGCCGIVIQQLRLHRAPQLWIFCSAVGEKR